VHSVIQARDGRRMSKSLGTGIDPLDEIEVHGADALRFGLLAMSSTQDVRYSDAKVQQGRDLANKMWNASRLVLLNGAEVAAEPRAARAEDRWILARLQRAVESVSQNLDSYDFAHAATDAYRFLWSELCDWYLEIAKPRLYEGDRDASATLLWVLEQTLALIHPMMPFVTEEIWSHHPARVEPLVVHPFPEPDPALLDAEAEEEIGAAIVLTRRLRRWRDLAGIPVNHVVAARFDGAEPPEFVGRLARFEFSRDGGDPIASVGPVEVLASAEVDADAVRSRIEARRGELRAEIDRAEARLANKGFVANAPEDVVAEEREKLAAYRSELEELDA
jgi:valyl-tRNA synthetase